MINFLSVCEDYSFLSVIQLIKALLEIICIIVPIALIIMSSIEISKIVINPDPKVIKDVMKRINYKVLAAILVYFVPMFVTLLATMLNTTSFSATSCWTNANSQMIKAFKEANEAKEEVEKEKIKEQQKQDAQERKIVAATREAARKDYAKAAEAAKAASQDSSGTATDKAARLIQVAQQEYNKHLPDSPNSITRAYGKIGNGYGYPWCAAFVWYCSKESGVYPSEVKLKTAVAKSYANYFKSGDSGNRYELSQHAGGNYTPKMGDYIFFADNHMQSGCSHVGLVKGVSGNKVLIIDGNCSNTVCDRSKYLSDPYIIGYGVWE